MNKNKIIHIPSVVADSKVAFHEMVKLVEVDVSKKLRCQIPDRQAAIGVRMKETFRCWQAVPVAPPPFDNAALARVVENGLVDKPQGKLKIEIHPAFDLVQCIIDLPEQHRFAYRHEVALNVELEHPGVSGVVARARPEEMLHALDAVMHAFAGTAAIGIVDKEALEYWRDVVVDEMVHDPVAEVGGEYLAFHRLVYNEADTWSDFVTVLENFISKLKDVVLEVFLERQSVDGVALITPGIEICQE